VKNKQNIFEELNKMKNLMHAKSGTVISEQADMGYDIATIKAELDNFNSDEQKIVDILKNYKDKASFQNFVNQYKTKTGKDFGVDVYRAVQPYNDKTEWTDLSNHLKSMGITLGNNIDNKSKIYSATFTGLDTPEAALKPEVAKLASDRQKNINNIFCTVKNGIIVNPASKFNNVTWEKWKATYKPTDAELTVAKKSCSSGQRRVQSGPTVNTRFADSAKSLGVQNGKMDLQTLQTILKNLEGETPITAAAPTQGTPDLAQLTAALNQLES